MSSMKTLMLAAMAICAIALPAASGAQAVAPATAQAPVPTATAKPGAAALAGPRRAPVGVQRHLVASATQRPRPQSMGKPMALMIVGGAAFVLGALIGSDVGTLFMLGGAVSFLIGLYEYVR